MASTQQKSIQQSPAQHTPTRQTSSQPLPALPVTPSPGTWRHPKFEEIARRQQAANFTDSNVTKLLWNVGAFVAMWPISYTHDTYPILHTVLNSLSSTLGEWPLWSLRSLWDYIIPLVLLYNIYTAASPLFIRHDELADIPLTPSQRSLLGLDPNATPPAAAGTLYVTPPRYQRSATPRSGTPGSRSSLNGSTPVSRTESPLGRSIGGSEFSPSASPLWQKAVGGSGGSRRHSYGLSSQLGPGGGANDVSVFSVPNIPSPSAGRGASVPLNSRWLYESGRSSSGGRSVFM